MKKFLSICIFMVWAGFVFGQEKYGLIVKSIENYVKQNSYELSDVLNPVEIIDYIEIAKSDIYNSRKELIENTTPENNEYSPQVLNAIKKEEKQKLAVLKKFNSVLELFGYKSSTFTDEMTVSISPFDKENGIWSAKVCSNLFDVENILNETVELSYSEVTGNRIIQGNKIKPEQIVEIKQNTELYDYLFNNEIPVVYVKMAYKVKVWQNASEYRFMPLKLEFFKIENNKSKKIKTVRNLPAKDFSRFPAVEIRDEKTIARNKKKSQW